MGWQHNQPANGRDTKVRPPINRWRRVAVVRPRAAEAPLVVMAGLIWSQITDRSAPITTVITFLCYAVMYVESGPRSGPPERFLNLDIECSDSVWVFLNF